MQTTDLQRAAFYGASGDGQDSAGRENRRCVFPETGIEKCRGAVTAACCRAAVRESAGGTSVNAAEGPISDGNLEEYVDLRVLRSG